MAVTGVAVVTGAGSGLGRAITRALLNAGWQVAVAGRRWAPLQETVGASAGPGGPALPVITDVTEPDSVAALFAAVGNRWGRADLLVNNAGVFGPVGAVDEITVADWRPRILHAIEFLFEGARLAIYNAMDENGLTDVPEDDLPVTNWRRVHVA